ncbi:hypothetical protein M8818_007744 [Zalaria obscura]|uniref:Uncharacterized protein n=1 Tax=Zalaria obscura TaxID=2024903 RepID=A0ACC3S2L2_9PEZI
MNMLFGDNSYADISCRADLWTAQRKPRLPRTCVEQHLPRSGRELPCRETERMENPVPKVALVRQHGSGSGNVQSVPCKTPELCVKEVRIL